MWSYKQAGRGTHKVEKVLDGLIVGFLWYYFEGSALRSYCSEEWFGVTNKRVVVLIKWAKF